MNQDQNMIQLYSRRILALAAEIPNTDRLENPDATAKVRSPLCGSTVTVDISLKGNKIAEFGQDVKACALGQAAASVVGANAVGRSRSDIETALNEMKSMLKQGGPPPNPPFHELSVLEPAKDYKNRHASILLALEATLSAFDEAVGRSLNPKESRAK